MKKGRIIYHQRVQELRDGTLGLERRIGQLEVKVAKGNIDMALASVNLHFAYVAAHNGDRELFEACGKRIDEISLPYLR